MRKRDYSAENARRNALAREQGYQSYWHKRETLRTAKAEGLTGDTRRNYIDASKRAPSASFRRDYENLRRAFKRGDTHMVEILKIQMNDLYPDIMSAGLFYH